MVVLIGAASFIGPWVLKNLLDRGHEVKCFLKAGTDSSKVEEAAGGRKVDIAFGNLNSADSVYSSIKGTEALVSLIDLKRTNYIKNILNSASRASIKRAVFLGSTTVLVPLESQVKKDKLLSEKLIAKSGLNYTILRASMIFGSQDDTNFSKMIRYIKQKGCFYLFGKGDSLIQPVYIEDAAEAVARVLDNKETFGKIYEISGKEPLKYSRMLEIVQEKMGLDFKIRKIPVWLAKAAAAVHSKISKNPILFPDQIERLKYDKTYPYYRAAKDFGYSPLSFEEGIEKLVKKIN